jgi:hypothetical protein
VSTRRKEKSKPWRWLELQVNTQAVAGNPGLSAMRTPLPP